MNVAGVGWVVLQAGDGCCEAVLNFTVKQKCLYVDEMDGRSKAG